MSATLLSTSAPAGVNITLAARGGLRFEVGLAFVSTARSLDNLRGRPDAAADAHVERLLANVLREETADEGVASAIRVDEFILFKTHDGEFGYLAVAR